MGSHSCRICAQRGAAAAQLQLSKHAGLVHGEGARWEIGGEGLWVRSEMRHRAKGCWRRAARTDARTTGCSGDRRRSARSSRADCEALSHPPHPAQTPPVPTQSLKHLRLMSVEAGATICEAGPGPAPRAFWVLQGEVAVGSTGACVGSWAQLGGEALLGQPYRCERSRVGTEVKWHWSRWRRKRPLVSNAKASVHRSVCTSATHPMLLAPHFTPRPQPGPPP